MAELKELNFEADLQTKRNIFVDGLIIFLLLLVISFLLVSLVGFKGIQETVLGVYGIEQPYLKNNIIAYTELFLFISIMSMLIIYKLSSKLLTFFLLMMFIIFEIIKYFIITPEYLEFRLIRGDFLAPIIFIVIYTLVLIAYTFTVYFLKKIFEKNLKIIKFTIFVIITLIFIFALIKISLFLYLKPLTECDKFPYNRYYQQGILCYISSLKGKDLEKTCQNVPQLNKDNCNIAIAILNNDYEKCRPELFDKNESSFICLEYVYSKGHIINILSERLMKACKEKYKDFQKIKECFVSPVNRDLCKEVGRGFECSI